VSLTVCTWNVNSVRLRLPQVERLLEARAPDVLCLQETKCTDAHFPAEAFAALGYGHQAVHGMKGYNGVAILSRRPLRAVATQSWCAREDCRHVLATVDDDGLGPVEIHNLYVPAGGDVPDVEANPKFAHKLRFLTDLTDWFLATRGRGDPLVLVGDLNVAPLPTDVYDHKRLRRVITHTPIEVEHLERLRSSLDWVDVGRRFVPPDQMLFTWWSYRQRGADWRVANRGRRLDHVWVTPALEDRLTAFAVEDGPRDWQPPSDHAPVFATLG
jgi:exodeoxyribonuclease-3